MDTTEIDLDLDPAQFIKNLSNTDAGLKKSTAYKKISISFGIYYVNKTPLRRIRHL